MATARLPLISTLLSVVSAKPMMSAAKSVLWVSLVTVAVFPVSRERVTVSGPSFAMAPPPVALRL
ncbi:hypothetical protein [Streptomyces sp. NBC_00572]|uniref:hypothetical protein n=1 Tax=Streptomyces sp. NBC_00572 TaxID=2903664 RepID=UPI00224DCA04|nr:hypothetical protein [Streptomyces sp. NBC_00572]MCX4985831.1 hypothetical protein [Streptomyces sp. NBC_00572]